MIQNRASVFNLLLYGLFIFYMLGCNGIDSKKKDLENHTKVVDLKIQSQKSPFSTSFYPFRLLDSIPEEFKGYSKSDSVFLAYFSTIPSSIIEEKLTNTNEEKLRHRIYALTGFIKGKRFYLLDSNFNRDFSDEDIVFSTEKTVDNSRFEKSNKDITYELMAHFYENDSVFLDKIFFEISFDNTAYSYSSPPKDLREKLKRESLILAGVNTFYAGSLETFRDHVNFDVVLNPTGFRGTTVLFKKSDEANYVERSSIYYREYGIGDTVELNKEFFRIHSFSRNQKSLKLKGLPDTTELFGYFIGSRIKNYEIELLNGSKRDLKSFINNKQYLLLDFWGTWCAPCVELTPNLVELNNTFENISILSIAHQTDKAAAVEYVNKNMMFWNHGLLYGNAKDFRNKPRIINELRVNAYPTFIILDSTLTIKFRGTGMHFETLKSFLQEEFEKESKY